MTEQDLDAAVNEHPHLSFIDCQDPSKRRIRYKNGQTRAFEFSKTELQQTAWKDLIGILEGRRPPSIMEQFTRITGYYSDIKNWNGSKRQELKARQRGNYSVPTSVNYDLNPLGRAH